LRPNSASERSATLKSTSVDVRAVAVLMRWLISRVEV
jgi:hypothetical protein